MTTQSALFIRAFCFIFAITGLTACATYSKKECSNMNWHNIAFEKGAEGNPRLQGLYDEYAKECGLEHGIYPNKTQMEMGYKAGLKQYCSEAGGIQAGASGRNYTNVCPTESAMAFMKGYQPARLSWLESEYARLNQENSRLQSKIDDLEGKSNNLDSEKRNRDSRINSLESSLLNCESQLRNLESRRCN